MMMKLREAKHNLRAYLDRYTILMEMPDPDPKWISDTKNEIATMVDAIERIKQGRF